MSLGLRLVDSDEWLDVPSNAKLKVLRENNIFFEGETKRDRTFPIDLPSSPTNVKLLGHLEKIWTDNGAQSTVSVWVTDGVRDVQKGTLVVLETQYGYKCHVAFNTGEWLLTNGDKLLKDLPFAPDAFGKLVSDGGDYPDENHFISHMAWLGVERQFKVVDTPPGNGYQKDQLFGVMCVYVNFIIKTIMADAGISSTSGDYFTDTELEQLALMGIKFDAEGPDSDSVYVSELMPKDLTVREFMESLQKLFCLAYELNSNAESIRIMKLDNVATATVQADYTELMTAMQPVRYWRPSRYSSGATFKWTQDILKAFPEKPISGYKLINHTNDDSGILDSEGYEENDHVVRVMSSMEAILWTAFRTVTFGLTGWWNSPTVPIETEDFYWCHLKFIGFMLDRTTNEQVYNNTDYPLDVITNWVDDPNGLRYAYNMSSMVVGDGKEVIESKIGTPIILNLAPDAWASHNLSVIPILFNHARVDFKEGWGVDKTVEECPPLLVFNRGEHDFYGASGSELRIASGLRHDHNGDAVGNYTLRWDTADGLYYTFWEQWLNTLSEMQEIEVMLHLSHEQIASIDFLRPIMIQHQKCFIKRLEYDLPLNGPVKAVLMKVK